MTNSSAAVVHRAGAFAGAPHQAVPLDGTYVSERTGQPATLTDEGCYPVVAECKVCHGPVRLRVLMQMDWQHAPAGQEAGR